MTAAPLRLVIFDVDGTLVDSQNLIVEAFTAAFEALGQPVPPRAALLAVVGLSLDTLFDRLRPDLDAATQARLAEAYRDAYMRLRAARGSAETSPLYPGAREALDTLGARPGVLLGVATGKSQRGLDKLIEGHGLHGVFVTRQVADFHPSKPHPAMVEAALAETGVAAADAVMVGDTSFDMDMAAAAGVRGIGVSWGYHGRDRLGAAVRVIDGFDALPAAIDDIWEGRA